MLDFESSNPAKNGRPDPRHGGGLNILYVDGHAGYKKVSIGKPYQDLTERKNGIVPDQWRCGRQAWACIADDVSIVWSMIEQNGGRVSLMILFPER